MLTPGKAEALWEIISKFKTLFSDFATNDFSTWAQMITNEDSIWVEVSEGDRVCGLVTFSGMSSLTECECHMLALDRQPAEKVPVWKAVIKWMFTQYPMLHRINMIPPTMYYAAIRTALKVGFVREGTKRETFLIRGRWADMALMGILRREAQWL